MRKIIVRTCALYYEFKIFKWYANIPRISTIMFPSLLFAGISGANEWTIPLYIFLGIFGVAAWIGFSWLGLGYFELWPVKREELSDMQKKQYDIFNKTYKYGR